MAAKLAAVAAPEAVSGHVAHRGEVPGVGRVVDGESAARDELSRPTLAAPVMLSELPDRGSGDGACGCERCAGDCARGVHAHGEHVRALVAAHVAWPSP